LGFSAFSFVQKQAADRSREQAVAQADRANREAARANGATKEAEEQREAAEKNALEATKQRNTAIEQQRLAEERDRLAQSRALASDSRRLTAQELDTALMGSVEAYRTSPTLDAKIALLENLSRVSKVVRYFNCPNSTPATAVAFSGDESHLAFACQSLITLVDLTSLHLETRDIPGDDIRAIAFTGSREVAIGGRPELRIVSFPNKSVAPFAAHSGRISAVTSNGDMLFTGDDKGEVRVWSYSALKRGEIHSTILRSQRPKLVKSLTYESANRILHVMGDGEAYLIDNISLASTQRTYREFDMDSSPYSPCANEYPRAFRYSGPEATSMDGRWSAYVTERNQIIVHDRNTCLPPLLGHTHNLYGVTFGGDGSLLASAGQIGRNRHGVILWDLGKLHPLAEVLIRFTRAPFGELKLALSSDGGSWACSGCGESILWDREPVTYPAVNTMRDVRVADIALSSSAQSLGIGLSDGRVLIAERHRGHLEVLQGPQHSGPVRQVWFTSDGLFSVGREGDVKLWSQGKSSSIKPVPELRTDTGCTENRTDGKTILAELANYNNSDAKSLWSLDLLRGLRQSLVLPASPHACSSIAFASRAHVGVRLSMGYDPIYIINDSPTLRLTPLDNPLHDDVSGLPTVLEHARISEDGGLLAATSNRTSVLLFDVASRRFLGELAFPGVRAIAISSKANRLLTAGEFGLARWDLDAQKWAHLAEEIAGSPNK
jgi:WD40 repeat protein